MFLNEEQYIHVINLMEGKERSSTFFDELKVWFEDKYKITVYDFICDYTSNGLIRLRLVLWDLEDNEKMRDGYNLDNKKQRQIAEKFSKLANTYHGYESYQDPHKIFVCYETIQDEISKRVLKKANINTIKHKDIWRIVAMDTMVHIFYQTDEQIEKHQIDGVSEMIIQAITDKTKKYDSYGLFKKGVSCKFTSKQTLDEKYDGNMYYYFL